MKSFKEHLDEIYKRLPSTGGDVSTDLRLTTYAHLSDWNDNSMGVATLQELGFKRAGSGSWGSVIVSKDYPFAIKFFEVSDRAYLAWYHFCVANAGRSPLLPVFRGKPHVVKMLDREVFAVRMEKLAEKHWGGDADKVDLLRGLKDLIIDHALRVDGLTYDSDASSDIEKQRRASSIQIIVDRYGSFVKKIAAYISHVGTQDLHYGNVMFRGSQVVITDPMKWMGEGKGDILQQKLSEKSHKEFRNFLRQT